MDEMRLVLCEYNAAQSSAEHHDRLAWSITTAAWLVNFILLGFVLGNLAEAHLRPVVNALATLGILLMLSAWFVTMILNSVKRQKYERCRKLEESLNRLIEKTPGTEHRFAQHRDVKYPQGRLTFFRTVLAWLLILVWLIVYTSV
jgi:uncharacterized membrane protein (DUF485 family)